MKWLKRRVIKWVREDWEEENKKCRDVGSNAVSIWEDQKRPDEEPILTFRIYSAVNGQVLEFRRWDRKNDRNHNSTYLIPKDEDIGDYVNKCLSMEILK